MKAGAACCCLAAIFGLVVLPHSSFADQGLTAEDFRGRTVHLERPAERVVCLIESALSGLYMLGVEDRVAAVSTNIYQEEVFRYYAAMDPRIAGKALPTPGNWDFVNTESVVGLQPDLVIIWASQSGVIEALTDKGIAVYAVKLDSFADVFKEIKDFGILFGRQDRAATLLAYAAGQLDGLAAATEHLTDDSRPGVYFMWAQGPLETSGAPSTVNDLIRLAGGRNVAARLGREHLVVNLEHILSWQPQVVVMWRNPRLSPQDVATMPIWQALPAAKSGRVFQLPSIFFCDLWTLKFVHAVKLIAAWCHPEKPATTTDMGERKREMLVALYGAEKGMRLPLDE